MFGRDEYFNVTTSCMYIWIGWQYFLSFLSRTCTATAIAVGMAVAACVTTATNITRILPTKRRSRENVLPLCGDSEWNIPLPAIQTIRFLVRRGGRRRRRRGGRGGKRLKIRTQSLHKPSLFQCPCQIQGHVVKLCKIGKGSRP